MEIERDNGSYAYAKARDIKYGSKAPINALNKMNDRIANIAYRQNSFIFQGGISYEF